MSKRVKKHCSILNYIRRADEDLYELVQDLCIGRMLVPRKGTPGLTFLRPDKALMSKIRTMAIGDDPEEAVAVLQSLVLLDHLPTPGDFDDKRADIPTFLRKKLPVASVDGKKINLDNGAEIVLDKDFEHRNDRPNMSVYIISKALVPTDTAPSDFSNAKTGNNRKIKGGGDFLDGKTQLFDSILAKHAKPGLTCNPAMEVLTSLCDYLESTGKSDALKAVQSQLSWDTLASLAIVLQPHRVGGDPNTKYISDADAGAWATKYKELGDLSDVYHYQQGVVDKYEKHMNNGQLNAIGQIQKLGEQAAAESAKVNVIQKIARVFDVAKDLIENPIRKAVLNNRKLALAEAELRVFSALLHDNSRDGLDLNEAEKLYKKNCNLTAPYMLNDTAQINMSNIGFYFSSAYLIARSNAMVYSPGYTHTSGFSEIADETVMLNIDNGCVDINALRSHYSEQDDKMNDFFAKWQAKQSSSSE